MHNKRCIPYSSLRVPGSCHIVCNQSNQLWLHYIRDCYNKDLLLNKRVGCPIEKLLVGPREMQRKGFQRKCQLWANIWAVTMEWMKVFVVVNLLVISFLAFVGSSPVVCTNCKNPSPVVCTSCKDPIDYTKVCELPAELEHTGTFYT